LYCSKIGLHCFEAEDGAGALKLARETNVALFLIDLGLPDMDGRDLLPLLRELDSEDSFRFYAATGAPRETKAELLRAGFHEVVFKPFSRERLRQVLEVTRTKPETPILEPSAFRDLSSMPKQVLVSLVETFEGEALERSAKLKAAARSADVETLRKEAHALKGAAFVVAAKALSELCQELERQATTGSVSDPVPAVDRIEVALEETLRQLRPR